MLDKQILTEIRNVLAGHLAIVKALSVIDGVMKMRGENEGQEYKKLIDHVQEKIDQINKAL